MINRKDIKSNFLNQIIFRLDFDGVIDSTLENVLTTIQPFLAEHKLLNPSTRIENQIDFQLKNELNLANNEFNPFTIHGQRINPVYCYSSIPQVDEATKAETTKYTLEISKTFLVLTLSIDNEYKSFDFFLKLLVDVIISLKNASSFFKPIRLGLRKINLFYIDKLQDIDKYFLPGIFDINKTLTNLSSFSCKASNSTSLLYKSPFHVNFTRDIQSGIKFDSIEQTEKTVFQLALDIDIFCTEIKQITSFLSSRELLSKTLTDQNTLIFEIFIKSLTDHFSEQLITPELSLREIRREA